jgi:hypothetical protein
MLLLGARSQLDATSGRALARLAGESVDWDALVGLAEREGVAALLHDHLARLGLTPSLPGPARARLHAIARGIWAINATLVAHWAEATTALRRAGIDTITLKGIMLAQTVYREVGLRPMADIDLLVRSADPARALEVLRACGYETRGDASERLAAPRGFAELVRGGTRIDLHWHLARYLRFEGVVRVDHDAIWRRARPLAAPAGRSLALCPEDLVLHLILHLTLGSEFARVLWYADIDAVIRHHRAELDWERLAAEARRWRIRRLAGWTLGVVHESFETPLPPGLVEPLARGRARRTAVARCIGMSSPPSLRPRRSDARVYLAQTLLMDRLADVVRVMVWTFFPSTTWLQVHYELTAWWQVALYRAVHPLRVCRLAVWPRE